MIYNQQDSCSFRVIIVGASVAGSTLAAYLGQHGIKVAIIDKEIFPRRKVCGEGISSRAISELLELKMLSISDLEALPHQPFSGYHVWHKNKQHQIATKDPVRLSRGIGIERSILDYELLKKALSFESVTGFFGYKATANNISSNKFEVTINKCVLSAEFLVLADGSNSCLANKFAINCSQIKTPRWGASATYDGNFLSSPKSVAVILDDDFEIILTAVSKTRLTASVICNLNANSILNNKRYLQKLIQSHFSKLAFKGELISEPIFTGPLGFRQRWSNNPNLYLIGDCIELLDPIGGMGTAQALISAKLAGLSLLRCLRSEMSPSNALNCYQKDRYKEVSALRLFSKLSSLTLRSKGRSLLLPLLGRSTFASELRDLIDGVAIKSTSSAMMAQILFALACPELPIAEFNLCQYGENITNVTCGN
jgi:flavin-dependent dehydrogenase